MSYGLVYRITDKKIRGFLSVCVKIARSFRATHKTQTNRENLPSTNTGSRVVTGRVPIDMSTNTKPTRELPFYSFLAFVEIEFSYTSPRASPVLWLGLKPRAQPPVKLKYKYAHVRFYYTTRTDNFFCFMTKIITKLRQKKFEICCNMAITCFLLTIIYFNLLPSSTHRHIPSIYVWVIFDSTSVMFFWFFFNFICLCIFSRK